MTTGIVLMSKVTSTSAYTEMVSQALPRLYGMARRMAGTDAEDLVQETLLRAFRRFDQLKDSAAASAWLATILLNVYRDRYRSAKADPDSVAIENLDDFSLYRHLIEEDPFPYSDRLHVDFVELFTKEDVHAVLMELPITYRAPLVLRYMEGYATKEISRLLGLPLGTVLSQLHRGRKLFERHVWDYAERVQLLKKEAIP